MLQKNVSQIQLLIRSWFSRVSKKINITRFKIAEILIILYFGFVAFIDKNLLFISTIIVLLLQFLSEFLYIKYDKKQREEMRLSISIMLSVILILSLTKIEIEICMFLLMIMCLTSSFFLGTSIANLLSFANMTFGFLAIYHAYKSDYLGVDTPLFHAMLLITAASIADFLDGFFARRSNKGKSEIYKKIGVLIDDAADGITFGLAISAMVFFSLLSHMGIYISFFIAMIYLICVIYRLYHFTKTKESVPNGYFEGLPSPAAGLSVGVGSLIFYEIPYALIAFSFFVSVAMVYFRIKWVHFKMIVKNSWVLCFAVPSLISLVYGTSVKNTFLLYPFFILSIIYIFHPVLDWIRKRKITN